MELFLSYRHKDWSFAHQLAAALRSFIAATIFVDYQSIDEPKFDASILSHLRKSDAVLLIVSKETFEPGHIHRDDDWVRREIHEALVLKKPIVVVLVEGLLIPADIPHDIQAVRRMEGIKFYPEYFDAGIKRLVEFILKATPLRSAFLEDDDETHEARPYGQTSLDDVVNALEQGDYDRALLFLEELRDNGYEFEVVSIVDLIADTQRQRDFERRQQEARTAYRDVAALARSKIMRDRARSAWITFQTTYPEFTDDHDHLAEKLAAAAQPAPSVERTPTRLIVPPTPKPIGEIIASVSDRSADKLSVEDVLDYFIDSPVDDTVIEPFPPSPDTKKGASSESARRTQEAKRI